MIYSSALVKRYESLKFEDENPNDIQESSSLEFNELVEKEIEFYLPLTLERLIMLIRAGHDISSALVRIVAEEAGSPHKPNPVVLILSEIISLTENGVSLGKAINNVANSIDSYVVKHALIYILISHQEGGEVINPLSELSDSIQVQLQDRVEEEIAKMPIKATVPLLCTFAGLIICFLTGPLIKFMAIVAETNPTISG